MGRPSLWRFGARCSMGGVVEGERPVRVARRTMSERSSASTFKEARAAADSLSERVRRLDIALQQQNWTVELVT